MNRKTAVFVLPVIAFVLCLTVMAAINQHRGTDALIVNTTLTLADTEYCYTAISDHHAFEIHARNGATVKMAFTIGASGTTYFTIPGGAIYSSDKILITNTQVLCWQSPTATTVVELILWR